MGRVVLTDDERGGSAGGDELEASFEIVSDANRALVTAIGVLLEKLEEERVERLGDLRIQTASRRRCLREVTVDQRERIRRLEREPTREELVKCDSEGVEIGALVHAAVRAAGLLRRDVGESSFDDGR